MIDLPLHQFNPSVQRKPVEEWTEDEVSVWLGQVAPFSPASLLSRASSPSLLSSRPSSPAVPLSRLSPPSPCSALLAPSLSPIRTPACRVRSPATRLCTCLCVYLSVCLPVCHGRRRGKSGKTRQEETTRRVRCLKPCVQCNAGGARATGFCHAASRQEGWYATLQPPPPSRAKPWARRVGEGLRACVPPVFCPSGASSCLARWRV